MSSICKNCGISGPAQNSKCFPSEIGNDIRHEFLAPAPAVKVHRVQVDFNKSVLDCSNIIPSSGSCVEEKLVDINPSINEAVEIVMENVKMESNDSGGVRLKPLVYARLARGGKTTFLIYLFAALRNRGCAPVLISFNGNFTRGSEESQLEALIRILSAAMMTNINPVDSVYYSFKGIVALLDHIERTAGGKPVVLLIDELNILSKGEPLDATVSQFLKRFFLDQKDRYIVFTSHILIDLDDDNSGAYWSTPSRRDYFSVHQPLSIDENLLRAMSEECRSLTSVEISLMGGIPSLIFASKGYGGGVQTTTHRFLAQKIYIEEMEQMSVLQNFISEVLDGRRIHHGSVRKFDMFSSILETHLVWWPLCYMFCILDLFPSILGPVNPFTQLYTQLVVHATRTETGLDWELIVQFALLLRCVAAKVNGLLGPFGICEMGCKPDIMCGTLVAECTSLLSARSIITAEMLSLENATIAIYTPVYAKFPAFDGFVAYCRNGHVRVFGYQCKLNRGYPKNDAPHDWPEKAFLLRGNAPPTDNRRRGWEYCSDEFIKSTVLGHSLAPLYPAAWKKGVVPMDEG